MSVRARLYNSQSGTLAIALVDLPPRALRRKYTVSREICTINRQELPHTRELQRLRQLRIYKSLVCLASNSCLWMSCDARPRVRRDSVPVSAPKPARLGRPIPPRCHVSRRLHGPEIRWSSSAARTRSGRQLLRYHTTRAVRVRACALCASCRRLGVPGHRVAVLIVERNVRVDAVRMSTVAVVAHLGVVGEAAQGGAKPGGYRR